MAAYHNGNNGRNVDTSISTTVDFLGRMIGASYKTGPVTVKASATYKVAASPGNLALGLDPHNNYVYAARLDDQALPQLDPSTGAYYIRDKNDSNNHSVTTELGASYFLSKRTTLYAQLGFIDNHGTENGGLTVINKLPQPGRKHLRNQRRRLAYLLTLELFQSFARGLWSRPAARYFQIKRSSGQNKAGVKVIHMET
ncbi:porin [Paraburkholderia strydomiana]|uniref:porin n=1 Tax=Paraburkholderia strydomiana TaxID=1245417 RepID=UPI00285D0D5D|nr:porin [Paraburkholderia strydomiana]MDR7009632.1 putative porin [Paraburkholderia strydomiana]